MNNEIQFPKNKNWGEQARFLLSFAVLASSSHNTQPWKFKIEKNVIKILPDYSRTLAYSDRTYRELFISLGCVLGNLEVVSRHFGFDLKVDFFPEDDISDSPIKVVFRNKQFSKPNSNDQLASILSRRTNRFPYKEQHVDLETINELIASVNDHSVEVKVVTDFAPRAKIVSLIERTSRHVFADSIFKEELSEWLRSVYTRRNDGIPLFDMGIARPLTIIAPMLMRWIPAFLQANLDERLFSSAPAFIIFLTKQDTKEHWTRVGRSLELVWLAATMKNLSLAPWAGLIEYKKARLSLKKIMNTDHEPIFFARLGYAGATPPYSPRRPVEATLA